MKKLIQSLVFYTLAIYFVGQVVPGFKVSTDLRGLIISGLCLACLFTFVNPLLKFLFLPINVLTLGLFSFVSQIITFYIFLSLFPDNFIIKSWDFNGLQIMGLGLTLKAFTVTPFLTIILSTGLISIIVSLLFLLV
jgi:putative membrane protein